MWASPRWFVILRDLACLVTGLIGILHQEFTGTASPLLLATYTTLLGVPGAVNVLAILKGSGGGSPPSAAPSPASSGESAPSSRPSADE